MYGLKVRGQRTRTTGRKGGAVGVVKGGKVLPARGEGEGVAEGEGAAAEGVAAEGVAAEGASAEAPAAGKKEAPAAGKKEAPAAGKKEEKK